MNFNFFEWIREGVRQSVLLGVSDAVEQIGTPHDEDEVTRRMLSHFQENASGGPRVQNRGGRKKLGRSLKSVQDAEKKAA